MAEKRIFLIFVDSYLNFCKASQVRAFSTRARASLHGFLCRLLCSSDLDLVTPLSECARLRLVCAHLCTDLYENLVGGQVLFYKHKFQIS